MRESFLWVNAMTDLYEKAVKRLESFGYMLSNNDKILLNSTVENTKKSIKNDCNVSDVPEGLTHIAVDMAIGEFLKFKLCFAPEDITRTLGINLDTVVKQIQVGDTSTTFAVGDGTMTPEQRLQVLINYLTTYGRSEFSCYRRIHW